jgi:hypothetical protein
MISRKRRGRAEPTPTGSPVGYPPKLTRHPLKWLGVLLVMTTAAIVVAHIGTLVVVALYYLAFQTIGSVKFHWDHLLSRDVHLLSQAHWTVWRHLVRGVGEGVLAGVFVQLITINHFKKRDPELSRLDRLEIALRVPNIKDAREVSAGQLIALPLLVVVYAIPGFVVGALVTAALKAVLTSAHSYAVLVGAAPASGGSTWSHVQTIWTGNRDQKIVGFFASVFMARRPMRAVADDVQAYFAGRRVALHKRLRVYHLPNFRARFLLESEHEALGKSKAVAAYRSGGVVPALLSAGLIVGLALAGFGYYVLAYIAK